MWIVVGELLARWSARVQVARLRALSSAGFPAIALTFTFAMFDWVMSLTPLWYSTIFGLLCFSGGFVAALALVAVIARAARGVPVVAATVRASHTGALGRLIFAFLAFWAYMEFSQGLIIWIANKPNEVPWYVVRGAGQWDAVFWLLVVGHLALPFFLLLSRARKRAPTALALIGGWLILMHYVDVYWLVMPPLHASLSLHWLDLAAPCAVLGLATAVTTARARTRIAVAVDDPRLADAVAYQAGT